MELVCSLPTRRSADLASVPCCGSAESRPNAVRSASVSAEVLILIVADLVAAIILTFGLYWRRHYRRDLVVAFFGINVGVLAVSAALADSHAGAGVGLGLLGVPSARKSTRRNSRHVA